MDANADYPAGLSGRAVLVYSSVGHLMFHFMGVFFFTIVLALQVAWEVPYHDLIKMWAPAAILTAAAALPAGWLGDRWSAPGIMVVFFIGMGLSAIAAGLAPERDIVWMTVALAGIGLFGSIYHPVGIPWVMRTARRAWAQPSQPCTADQFCSSSSCAWTCWAHTPPPASVGSGPTASWSDSESECAGSVERTSVRPPMRRAVAAATEVFPTPPLPV